MMTLEEMTLEDNRSLSVVICVVLAIALCINCFLPFFTTREDYKENYHNAWHQWVEGLTYEDCLEYSLLELLQIHNAYTEKIHPGVGGFVYFEKTYETVKLTNWFLYLILFCSIALIYVAIKQQPRVLRVISAAIVVMVLVINMRYTTLDEVPPEQYTVGLAFYGYIVETVLMWIAAGFMQRTIARIEYIESYNLSEDGE